MVKIGNVEIPIVSSIDEGREAEVDDIKPVYQLDVVPVKHESKVQSLVINGFLNEETHSSSLSLGKQKNKVKNLRGNKPKDNDINYRDYKGHLLVENVDLNDNSDSKIIHNVEIEARYFPWPKFYPHYQSPFGRQFGKNLRPFGNSIK